MSRGLGKQGAQVQGLSGKAAAAGGGGARGLTLLEVMIAVAILVVMMGMAWRTIAT